MGANLTLNMEARLDEIDRIHAAVEILAAAEGWEPDLVFQIKLVVEEIGTNIVSTDTMTRETRIFRSR